MWIFDIDTWNTSSAALGRTMIGALMLGATLKGEDKMTVKIEGINSVRSYKSLIG
jgi:redox-regulated HSP33 family molecular chaperone